jgi:hypothetical protein
MLPKQLSSFSYFGGHNSLLKGRQKLKTKFQSNGKMFYCMWKTLYLEKSLFDKRQGVLKTDLFFQ